MILLSSVRGNLLWCFLPTTIIMQSSFSRSEVFTDLEANSATTLHKNVDSNDVLNLLFKTCIKIVINDQKLSP